MPVAIGVHQQLSVLPAPRAVDQHHVLHRVPIVPVVWRKLIVPLHLSGVRVESDDGVGEEVVPFRQRGDEMGLRRRISNRPVDKVELRVVAASQPRRTTAGFSSSRLSMSRCRIHLSREWCRSTTAALPVAASYASRKPRVAYSPPVMPVMTMSFSTSGGLVMLDPSIVSTTGTSQRG